jgi:hypothetical protein
MKHMIPRRLPTGDLVEDTGLFFREIAYSRYDAHSEVFEAECIGLDLGTLTTRCRLQMPLKIVLCLFI